MYRILISLIIICLLAGCGGDSTINPVSNVQDSVTVSPVSPDPVQPTMTPTQAPKLDVYVYKPIDSIIARGNDNKTGIVVTDKQCNIPGYEAVTNACVYGDNNCNRKCYTDNNGHCTFDNMQEGDCNIVVDPSTSTNANNYCSSVNTFSVGCCVHDTTPDEIKVVPVNITIKVGHIHQFRVNFKKDNRNITPDNDITVWSTSGGIGIIDANGLFTATTPGRGEAIATFGNLTSHCNVRVIGNSETGNLTGKVMRNQSPVSEAVIKLSGVTNAGVSDASGNYNISDIANGTYPVSLSVNNQELQSSEVIIVPAQTTTQDFYLETIPTPTNTPTPTVTSTPTATPTNSNTMTPTVTQTVENTATATPIVPPSATATYTPTATPTPVKNYSFRVKWGHYGDANGEFQHPKGVALDSIGNVYVADTCSHRVQKFDADGYYISKFGQFGTGDGQLSDPSDLQLDRYDNIYVVENGSKNCRVQKFTSNGAYLMKFGSKGSGDGQFNEPSCIAITKDDAGEIYIADSLNHRIERFDSTGQYLSQWGSYGNGNYQFNTPIGIEVDTMKNVYVADKYNHRVCKYTSNGTFVTTWGTFGNADNQFNYPVGIAIDSYGSVYVSDRGNARVQKFSPDGELICKFSSANPSEPCYPYGLVINSAGNVYMADDFTDCITVFMPGSTFRASR